MRKYKLNFLVFGLFTFFVFSSQLAMSQTASNLETTSSFQIGSSIIVSTSANTSLNVRSSGTTGASIVGTQPTGATGQITTGPVQANGYTWWNVNYTNGADGWSAGNYLILSGTTSPSSATTSPSSISSSPTTTSTQSSPVSLNVSLTANGLDESINISGATSNRVNITWSAGPYLPSTLTCTGSGGTSTWPGAKPLIGFATYSVTTPTTFAISCRDSFTSRTVSDSVTVNISGVISTPGTTVPGTTTSGCTSTTRYSATTGQLCSNYTGVPSTTIPPGCPSTTGVSTTTGQSCGNNTTVPIGINTTPSSCSTTTTTGTSGTGPIGVRLPNLSSANVTFDVIARQIEVSTLPLFWSNFENPVGIAWPIVQVAVGDPYLLKEAARAGFMDYSLTGLTTLHALMHNQPSAFQLLTSEQQTAWRNFLNTFIAAIEPANVATKAAQISFAAGPFPAEIYLRAALAGTLICVASPSTTPTTSTPPTAPQNVVAIGSTTLNTTGAACGSVSGSFSPVTGATIYRVFRNGALISGTDGSLGFVFQDSSLASGTYTYTVTAISSGGVSSVPSAPSTVVINSCGNGLTIGKIIKVTSSSINVRSQPSISGSLLGSQPFGARGVIIGGPVQANGYTWWEIDYRNSSLIQWSSQPFVVQLKGWSAENYIEETAAEIGRQVDVVAIPWNASYLRVTYWRHTINYSNGVTEVTYWYFDNFIQPLTWTQLNDVTIRSQVYGFFWDKISSIRQLSDLSTTEQNQILSEARIYSTQQVKSTTLSGSVPHGCTMTANGLLCN